MGGFVADRRQTRQASMLGSNAAGVNGQGRVG